MARIFPWFLNFKPMGAAPILYGIRQEWLFHIIVILIIYSDLFMILTIPMQMPEVRYPRAVAWGSLVSIANQHIPKEEERKCRFLIGWKFLFIFVKKSWN